MVSLTPVSGWISCSSERGLVTVVLGAEEDAQDEMCHWCYACALVRRNYENEECAITQPAFFWSDCYVSFSVGATIFACLAVQKLKLSIVRRTHFNCEYC